MMSDIGTGQKTGVNITTPSILGDLEDHPCHSAAEVALAELVKHSHGHPIEARGCDDGSIALEMRGDRWRVLLCLEADHTESGWSFVRVFNPFIAKGNLDNIALLSPLIKDGLSNKSDVIILDEELYKL
jgi:hypothetical protein